MQTKLFVFVAFLAFCHVSYCDPPAGSVPPTDDAQKMLEPFKQGLTATMDTLRATLESVFNGNMVMNITNAIVSTTNLTAQQVQEIVQKTLQTVQENLKAAVKKVDFSQLPVSQVEDVVVKSAEMFPAALKNVFSFLENITHDAKNQPATVAPASSKK